MRAVEKKENLSNALVSFLKKTSYDLEEANNLLQDKEDVAVKQTDKFAKLLSRPNIKREDILRFQNVTAFLEEKNMDDAS
jgi:tRNA uridine 5-carboxymethylaminomethyl modification enzyme